MNNQDTWDWYTASPWNGDPLPDGSHIALRATQYMDELGAFGNLNNWVTTMPFQYNDENPEYDYVTASESGVDTGGCVFRVTTCPQPSDSFPDGPGKYQLITLQGASGSYLTLDGGGAFSVSGSQDDALIFVLDRTLGQQTIFWHIFSQYKLRNDITLDYLTRVWSDLGVYQDRFSKLNATYGSSSAPILYKAMQGEGDAALLDVFVMTLTNGLRVKDLNNGAVYLALDGTLHLVPENTNGLLFASPVTNWSSVNGIETIGSYPIGPPLDMWALVAFFDGGIYFIENNTKRLFANLFVFERFGFKMDYVRSDFTPELLAEFQDGPVIS